MKRLQWMSFVFVALALSRTAATAALVGSPQQAGLVVVSAPSGSAVSTTSANWVDMPQMKGAISLSGTSDLAVTICAETSIANDQRIFVRAVVENAPASPSEVVLASSPNLQAHCFTFVSKSIPAGVHTVGIQWLVDSGSTGYLGDRTLQISFAQPTSEELKLVALAAPSGPDVVISGIWSDIPNISSTLGLSTTSNVAITFSSEVYTTNSARLSVRALVDGNVADPSDEALVTGGYTGTRSFTFVRRNLPSGTHEIRIQSYVAAVGLAHLGDRTLKVIGVPSSGAKHAGSLMVAAPSGSPQATTSSDWVDLPDLLGTVDVPAAGDVVIGFSAEMWATSGQRVFARALLDGLDTSPSDVLLPTSGLAGTSAYSFVKRNVSRGSHTVTIQWHTESGDDAHVASRTLAVYTLAKQQPVLFIAMESERGETGYPFGGYFSNRVVDVVGGQRIFKPHVRDRLFGMEPSVADHLLENSAGRFFMTEAGILGPYLKQYAEKYYRENVPEPFTTMLIEAWTKADQTFDFSLYDRNGDGSISRDELVIAVVFYQDSPAGFVRNIPPVVTNDGVTLDGLFQPHFYSPDFQEEQVGIFAHEFAHVMINAADMYETSWDPTAPGPYSLMDQHGAHPHLDPYHKIRAGNWFEPTSVIRDGYYEITAVEKEPKVYKLQDPASHAGEYFLVENRQQVSYDRFLPDSGLAIWHIDETRTPVDYRTAVEIVPSVGATNPIQYQNYLWDGAGSTWGTDFWDNSTPSNSSWHDGTPSRIGVWAIPQSRVGVRVFLDVPGPGILVQAAPDTVWVEPAQAATFQIRLVNTGSAWDTFLLFTNLAGGGLSWSQNPVSLAAYEERIVSLTATPTWGIQSQIPFTVTAQSISNPSVFTSYPSVVARVEASFVDVPPSYWAWSHIEALYAFGITKGCSQNPLSYCPEAVVTRAQMAVFLVRAKYGPGYEPVAARGVFADVPVAYWAAPWIERLYADGITKGCGQNPLTFCPEAPVTRDQAAVFLIRSRYGTGYVPPPSNGFFADVPTWHWAAPWIEKLYSDRVTTGCGQNPLRYCPETIVTRDQMAVFLVRLLNLPRP